MQVQPVIMPASGTESWTVLGDDDVPVVPVERYLAYLTDVERSPNTVRAYAHDLKDYWQFLACRGLDWRHVRLEDIGDYVTWLRLPPAGRDGAVAGLPSPRRQGAASTLNPKLSALAALFPDPAPPRAGEALGLRHEDIAAAEQQISVVPRVNANRARCKSRDKRVVPVSAQLIRLYGDYLHGEYGDLDSDYVFVNLFASPRGQAMTYPAVYDLVRRLRRRTGIEFDLHWFRHSAATRMLRDGVPLEVVSKVLGHSSVVTTQQIYGHLTAEDPRKPLEAAGWFTRD